MRTRRAYQNETKRGGSTASPWGPSRALDSRPQHMTNHQRKHVKVDQRTKYMGARKNIPKKRRNGQAVRRTSRGRNRGLKYKYPHRPFDFSGGLKCRGSLSRRRRDWLISFDVSGDLQCSQPGEWIRVLLLGSKVALIIKRVLVAVWKWALTACVGLMPDVWLGC